MVLNWGSSLRSLMDMKGYTLYYAPWEWTYPMKGTKIFVYDSIDKVDNFLDTSVDFCLSHIYVYECEIQGKPIKIIPARLPSNGKKYYDIWWEHIFPKLNKKTLIHDIMDGLITEQQKNMYACLVDAVKLTRFVKATLKDRR